MHTVLAIVFLCFELFFHLILRSLLHYTILEFISFFIQSTITDEIEGLI